MAALTLTAGVAGYYALQPVGYAHAEAPAYKGSVEGEFHQKKISQKLMLIFAFVR